VCPKLQAVLKGNLGFLTITCVCQVLNGKDIDHPKDIAPEKILLLKYTSVTSCDIERSFSAYKHILSNIRQSMIPEDMENILIVYCASKNQ
jgi:hypothetical protein